MKNTALVVMLALPCLASASDYADGYVNSDGYTFHLADRYWYLGGTPYIRESWSTTSYTTSCDCYGRCYQVPCSSSYWKYFPVVQAQVVASAYVPPIPTVAAPPAGWRAAGIDYLKNRDELAAYLQFVKTTGPGAAIDQGPLVLGAAPYPNRALYYLNNPQYSSEAIGQGDTKYAYVKNGSNYQPYTVADVAAYYGKTDPGLLIQGQQGLVKELIEAMGKGQGDSNALVQAFVSGEHDSANKLAAALAAAAVLNAAQGNGSSLSIQTQSASHSTTGVQTPTGPIAPTAPAAPTVEPPAAMPPAADYNPLSQDTRPSVTPHRSVSFQATVNHQCGDCHVRQQKGDFDLSSYSSLSPEQKKKVLTRLTSDNPKTRMPRVPDGSEDGAEGTALSVPEILEYTKH